MDRDRIDRQITMVRDHLMAECEEAIAEAGREVAQAVARRDEHSRRYWEECVQNMTAQLHRWQAEARAAT